MALKYNITYRKKDKGWQYIISYKLEKKWKQRSKQGYKSRSEAKFAADESLEKLKEEIKLTGSVLNDKITFKELKDLYITKNKYYLAASTMHNLDMSMKPFNYLENYAIKDITKDDIQVGVTNMIKKGNKPVTIKSRVDYVKILFNYAINEEVLCRNPVNGVKLPKNRKNKNTRRALEVSEVNALLFKLKHARGKNAPYYYLASLIAYTCGLRVGEILALNYNDFNFKDGVLIINKQYSRFDDGKITDPKSQNSNRVVPVTDFVLEEVKNFMRMNGAAPGDMIFNIKSIESFDKMINNRYKMLGFNVCIHELRHTYATDLIASGKIDIKSLAYLLGHDMKMTMNVYTHVSEDMMENAKKTINKLLNKKLKIEKDAF